MRWHPTFHLAGAIALALAAGAVLGCSNKSTSAPVINVELNSGSISGSSGTYSHTFVNPGTYPYHCSIHLNMNGSVTVANGNPTTASVSIVNSTDTGFQPGAVSINPGGMVTWTNISGIPHTVTSNAPTAALN